jgi:iron complex outermembrane recepter protein
LIGGLSLNRGFSGPGISIVASDGSVSPVRLHTLNNYYGLYITDTVDITERLSGTLSARFNSAQITLHDQLGTDLNGVHSYNRLNPAAGLTYKLTPTISLYGGYAETNRAPTPAELSCADPLAPCSLTNFFVGDPHLNQVVAHTFEVGVRGAHNDGSDTKLEWNFGLFRTNNDDDILFVSSPTVGRAFFRNVGETRRQGIELGFRFRTQRLNIYANYAFTDATFQTALTLNSKNNPFAGPDGTIRVQPGNKLPGVPRNLFKIGADYNVTTKWVIGFSAIAATGKYLVGDESNVNPTTGAYGVVNVHSAYQITEHFQAFALMNNVLNTRYATFGTFSPVTSVPLIQAPGSTNTRSLTLAPPISMFGGIRAVF